MTDMITNLRKSAESSRADAERHYNTSEYPRYGRAVHNDLATAIDALADWLDENGTEPTTGSNRYESRKIARVYWLKRKALEKKVESARLAAESHDMGSRRPLGQPLVGSPARRRAQRNAIERERRKDQKAYNTHNEAVELERRARAAENNTAISSADPEAINKLKDKLKSLESTLAGYKARKPKTPPLLNYRKPEGFKIENRYHAGQFDHYDQIEMTKAEWKRKAKDFKSTRVVDGHRIRTAMHNEGGRNGLTLSAVFLTDSKEHAEPAEPAELDTDTTTTTTERVPVYRINNLNAEIRRVKSRIAELESRATYTARDERTIGDVRVVDNLEYHKVELHFPSKPDEETRRLIKRYGFRWVRSVGCWSRSIGSRTEDGLEALARHLGVDITIAATITTTT